MALFSTNHTLTQGSLHYRLATLGYQKQNPDGVRQSANILCADPPFEIAIKNGTPMGFVNLQTSFAPTFLLKWLSKAEGDGGRLFCKHPLPALPSPWRGVGGEALMLRLYSKLGIFLWFSFLFHIFHQA